jgi:predicted dehydrogenase/threonine dehydrogenase-like Zn-dependent dehydrogenase
LRQVAQNYRSGSLEVLDVPEPACRPGGVLVRSLYSLISTGTELMKVAEASKSLVGKARARPDQVRKVLDNVSKQGVRATYTKAMRRLDSYTPLGYSLCGRITEVGRGAEDLKVGQLVACAGNEYALHSDVNWVPRNLCVPVPDSVDPRLAAFATVGAIAMHGIRRSEPQLGDTACVVGLGLVGQLTVQLLVAAGVRVVGLDPLPDRCRLAEKAGASACDGPTSDGLARVEQVIAQMTGGLGADHVLLTAGGATNGPAEIAVRLARDRAHVVDVGKLRLDLPWNAYYEKELDVRFSRSYGPGRYDDSYELDGVDYPAGYVRWTERRNLSCFVDLLARGALATDLLVSGTFPLPEARSVYSRLRSGDLAGIGYLFEYGNTDPASHASMRSSHEESSRHRPAPKAQPLRIGFIGAGNYAASMLLPQLAQRGDVDLVKVVTNTSLSAANARRRFGFSTATTDVEDLLNDDDVDAVFIVTRHHSHAELVCRALATGKATFVEKPLALDGEQLSQVMEAVTATGNDRLMVGFNRRFSPMLVDLRRRFGTLTETQVVRYSINAGALEPDSWYRDEQLEGSRFCGEGGHFLDTIGWWLDAAPREVYAVATRGGEGIHVTVRYDDGSVAGIDYLTTGNPKFPKETFEASGGGRTARFENFKRATVWKGRRAEARRSRTRIDKGQVGELDAFLNAVRTGGPMPISIGVLASTTAATLAVGQSLVSGTSVTI